MLGGLLVRKFNLKKSCKLSAKYCLIFQLLASWTATAFIIPGCDELNLAGVVKPYHNRFLNLVLCCILLFLDHRSLIDQKYNTNSGDKHNKLAHFIADTPGPRESVIARIYFSQTSAIYFCWRFSCCPYYRGIRKSEVSAWREFTE